MSIDQPPPEPIPREQYAESRPDPPSILTPASGMLAPNLAVHAELLSRIWRQSLPLMQDRVTSLERSAALAGTGDLVGSARTGAADIAHKLAGSLGMFGYPRGTEIAREMEELFEAEGTPDAERLAQLAAALRAALPL